MTSISTFFKLMQCWTPGVSVLIRGNHGIGKSETVYQAAEMLGLPVMERRLSQMSEGDMIGLPWQERLGDAVTDTAVQVDNRVDALAKLVGVSTVDSNYKVTSFAPPDWLAKCAEAPYVIFLDELNRATPEVMQAAFQLVLDRRVGSLKIHPDCRVIAAINVASNYQVNEMDPALLDRFAVVDLEPTVEDWTNWARTRGGINQLMIDFITQHPSHLELTEGKVTPGTITPSRRSWARVDACLRNANLYDNASEPLFYQVSASLVGPAAAAPWQKFCIDNKFITAEDVLDRWSTTGPKVKAICNENRVPELTGIIDRLRTYLAANTLTSEQFENYTDFVMVLPAELVVSCWTAISQCKNIENIKKCQGRLSLYFVSVVEKGRKAGNAS